MSVREVLRMGEPSLLRVSEPVANLADPELATLIRDLFDTMEATAGVGLSAPQIGVPLQVVVFGFDKNTRYPDVPPIPITVLINPVITPLSNEEALDWEGCLSIPGMRGEVPRFTRIRYQGLAPDGTTIDCVAEDFHARVVQHECDHLMGTLYPMRMRDMSRFGFTDVLFPEQRGEDAR